MTREDSLTFPPIQGRWATHPREGIGPQVSRPFFGGGVTHQISAPQDIPPRFAIGEARAM